MENEEIVIDIKIELDSDNNKSNEQFCQSSGDKSIVTQDTEDIDNEVENTDRKIHLIQYFSENTDNFRSTADQIQYKPATHTYTVNAVHGDASQHFHEEMGDAVKNEEIYVWDKHTGDTSCLDQHAENNLIQTFICSHEMDDHEAIKIKQEPIGDDISELCSEITNEKDTYKQQTVNWSPVSIPWQVEYVDTKINKIKQEQNEEFDMEMCQARGNSSDTYANNEKELSGGRALNLLRKLLVMDSASEDELKSTRAIARQDSDCAVCGKSFKTKSGLQRHVSVHGTSIPWQAEYVDTKINKIKQEQNEEFDMEICQAIGTSPDTYANNEIELSSSREAHLNNPLLLGYEKTCSEAFQIKIENHEIPEEDYCPVKDERNESESKSLLSHKLLAMDSASEDELKSTRAIARQDSDCAVCGKSFKTKSGLQRHVSVHGTSIPWQAEYVDTKINKIKQEQNEEFDMEMCQARGNSSDTYANNEKELSGGREAHLNNPLLLGYEKTCSEAFQIKIENHEIPEEDDCPVKDERNESESKSLLSHNMPMSCEQDADTYEPFNSMGTKAKENLDTGGRIRKETRACMYNITTEEGNKAAEITVNATPLTLFKKVITKDSQVLLYKQYTRDNSALRKCFHCTWHTSSEEKYKVHLQNHINRFNMARKSKAEVDVHMHKIKCHFKELNWNLDVVKCEKRTCVYIFLDDEWASKHCLTYHEGNAFVCSKPNCFRTFKDNWKLRSHEIADHAFNIKDRKKKGVLNDHTYLKCQVETEHVRKTFICSKPYCFRTFEDKGKWRSHEIVEHAVMNEKIKAGNTKKTSVGKQTDVSSWTKAVLNDHCYFDVQLETNFRCDVRNCFKLFKCMAEMKSHKVREHSATVSFSGNDHLSDLNCSDNVKSEHNYDCGSSQIYDNIDSDTVFKGVLYADERGNVFHGGRVIFKINKPN